MMTQDREYIRELVESQMEQALSDGEFKVYLQPKINMVTDKIVGAEALSRWVRPGEGVRMPDMYIPVFEKNGFVSRLDMYMFREVCKLKAAFKGEIYEHIVISVNMSRIHLYDEEFPARLSNIADEYEIPHSELEIEITESVFFDDAENLIARITEIQDQGFPVSIDDFGSGYSALNMLKDIMADVVKLDMVFLRDSSNSNRGKTVIRSIISMCRDLKMEVVCEGVETKEHVELLTKCGCQVGQGFLYSKAINVADFRKYASDHLNHIYNNCEFRFNGSLDSNIESITAKYVREGKSYDTDVTAKEAPQYSDDVTYVQGIFKDSKALYLPGGKSECNTVEITPDVIVNDSFMVSFWIKTEKIRAWSSVIYIKFETGFVSFNPLAWEGHSSFRVRDSREVNGWYDTSACWLEEGLWWHVVISFNGQTDVATLYVNGDVISITENVRTNRYVKRVVVGGDVFQPSYNGAICEMTFYNEVMDYDYVAELHKSYTSREDFIGGPLKKLI